MKKSSLIILLFLTIKSIMVYATDMVSNRLEHLIGRSKELLIKHNQRNIIKEKGLLNSWFNYEYHDKDSDIGPYFSKFGYYCYIGDLGKVSSLLNDAEDRDECMVVDGYSFSALDIAVEYGQVDIVELLLKDEPLESINQATSEYYITPLHTSVALEDKESRYLITKMLLEAGANPDGFDTSDNLYIEDSYPILDAIYHADSKIIKLLLDYGASLKLDGYIGNGYYLDIVINSRDEKISEDDILESCRAINNAGYKSTKEDISEAIKWSKRYNRHKVEQYLRGL